MLGKLSATAGVKRSLAPPSPSPSNASNASPGTPAKRQKREREKEDRVSPTPTPAAAAAAASTGNYGADLLTQLTYAVEFLKTKNAAKTLQEVLDHLSLQHHPEKTQNQFAQLMRSHPRVAFVPSQSSSSSSSSKNTSSTAETEWRLGTYAFQAKIPGVHSKAALLEHLQRKTDASKLDVKDLKDGWPDCDKAIDELEAEHHILVVRTKKDGHAKFIWIDTPQLFNKVDPEFQSMWAKVELPSLDDIVRRLAAVGQKPASEDPRLKTKETTNQNKQKRRTNRANKRVTNAHMQHLLQDYSHLKRG